MDYIGFGAQYNEIERIRRRRQAYLVVAGLGLVLCLVGVASNRWVVGNTVVNYNGSGDTEASSCPGCDNIDLDGVPEGYGTSRENEYRFGLFQYRGHAKVSFESGSFESVCYIKIENMERLWNRQAEQSDDDEVKNLPRMSAEDFEAPAGFMVTSLTLYILLVAVAIGLAMGAYFPSFISGSVLQWTCVVLQAFVWIFVVSAVGTFNSAKVKTIVCDLVDPARAVKCGYGAGYGSAACAIFFLLLATAVSYWAFSDVDAEANKAAGGISAVVGLGGASGAADEHNDAALSYKPNTNAFGGVGGDGSEPPQDGDEETANTGGPSSYQSL